MLKYGLTCSFGLAALATMAQQDSVYRPLFKISSFYAGFYLSRNPVANLNQHDFARIMPGSDLAKADLSAYTLSSNGTNFDLNLNAGMGFRRKNPRTGKYFTNRENRINFRCFYDEPVSLYYSKHQYTPFDTLTVKQNGVYYYLQNGEIDSSWQYNFNVVRKSFLLDFSTVFESGRSRLLSFYGGYLASLGLSMSNSAAAHSSSYVSAVVNDRGAITVSDGGNDGKSEFTYLRNTFAGGLDAIGGINLRMAKTRKFWSRFVVNTELRVGMRSDFLSNYGMLNRLNATFLLTLKALLD